MLPSSPLARAGVLLALPLLALGASACGNTVSTSGYSGETREVAQTISNFQADATAGEQKKVCSRDLAAAVLARLGGTSGCEAAIKNQLTEVDNLELSVQSIALGAGASTATAQVKGTYAGKKRTSALALLKEGGKWKISGLP